MNEEERAMLIENNAILKKFEELFNTQLAGKEFSFSPDPNDTSVCPKAL